jgi:hypothetical protein
MDEPKKDSVMIDFLLITYFKTMDDNYLERLDRYIESERSVDFILVKLVKMYFTAFSYGEDEGKYLRVIDRFIERVH